MNPFIDKHCRDYSVNESSLNLSDIEENRKHTPDWQYCATENHLIRTYHFSDYDQTITFVNQVADVAKQQDHHPQMDVSYNRCKVSFSTHTVDGLTENDFICAAKIDALTS